MYLKKEDLEAKTSKFLKSLDASRKSGRVSAKAVKRKAGLSSIASRAKGRAPSLRSIVREVQAYRRAKRTSNNPVEATQGILRVPRKVVMELTRPHQTSLWDR